MTKNLVAKMIVASDDSLTPITHVLINFESKENIDNFLTISFFKK